MVRVGQYIKIISDNDYYKKYRNKILRITNISRNEQENPYYDRGIAPEELVDLETLKGDQVPFSIYEYEFEIVNPPEKKKRRITA